MNESAVNQALADNVSLTTLGGTCVHSASEYEIWTFPNDDFALLVKYMLGYKAFTTQWLSTVDDARQAIIDDLFVVSMSRYV